MKEEAKRHNGLIGFIGWSATDTHELEAGYYVVSNNILKPVTVQSPVVLSPRYAYADSLEIPVYTEMPEAAYKKIKFVKGVPSALNQVNVLPAETGTYDLLGRKIANPQAPGIYIINGQKTVVTLQ